MSKGDRNGRIADGNSYRVALDYYFDNLLSFRLRHYETYGFGVHGVWAGDKLIGQFGLQTLDERLDRVEFVVFMGTRYKRRGIGSSLVSYLIGRCQASGMADLYAVVRPDNPEGTGLVKKFGWLPINSIEHFGYPATVCRLDLSTVPSNANVFRDPL